LYDTSFPPNTALCLGQLITHPRQPTERVGNKPLDINDQMLLPVRNESDLKFDSESGTGFGIGFSATVLSFLPFVIEGDKRKSTKHRYEISKVEERMFVPTGDYVKQSVLQSDVLEYLAKHRYKKSLYMIVGIKVGCDAKVIHQKHHEMGGNLGATIPGASVGIPVDLGCNIGANADHHRGESKYIPTSFVFAYRLREIRYNKRKVLKKNSEFTKGADLHSLDGGNNAPVYQTVSAENYIGVPDEIDLDGIAGADYEEDEEDSKIFDCCMMVSDQKSE
jgi:hypothetical protein